MKTFRRGEHVVGEYDGEVLFHTMDSSRNQWVRKYNSPNGLDAKMVTELLDEGTAWGSEIFFLVLDTATDTAYLTDLTTLLENGTLNTLNENEGPQWFMHESLWDKVENWSTL